MRTFTIYIISVFVICMIAIGVRLKIKGSIDGGEFAAAHTIIVLSMLFYGLGYLIFR